MSARIKRCSRSSSITSGSRANLVGVQAPLGRGRSSATDSTAGKHQQYPLDTLSYNKNSATAPSGRSRFGPKFFEI